MRSRTSFDVAQAGLHGPGFIVTAAGFATRPRPGLVALKRSLVAAEKPLADYLVEEQSSATIR